MPLMQYSQLMRELYRLSGQTAKLPTIKFIVNNLNDSFKHVVRDIGLVSDVISRGGFFFGNDTTLANFHTIHAPDTAMR